MKLKGNKDFIKFLVLVTLLLFVAFYISSMRKKDVPSVKNNNESGCSVFYETLRELKLPVFRTTKPLNKINSGNIQVIVEGGSFDIYSDEVKEWLDKGGILLYLTRGETQLPQYHLLSVEKDNIYIYEYNNGVIIVSDVSNVTNKVLRKRTSDAYELLKQLDGFGYNNIYFNERYLYSVGKENTLWNYIPLEIKFIIYQFIIIILAFFHLKGKRFGKVIPLYNEVERNENEYLYSTAALYSMAKCWDVIFENYYNSFLKEMNYYNDNWIEYWEQEDIHNLDKAKKVYKFVNDKNKKVKEKEYIEMIKIIEELKDSLKKRREINWKTLKKTQ